MKFRKTEISEIDEVLMKWFHSVRAKNIHVSGVLLQEKTIGVGESFWDFKLLRPQMNDWENSGHVTTYLLNRFVSNKNM